MRPATIRGGRFYGDSQQIDMLWTPLQPAQGGEEKNKRGQSASEHQRSPGDLARIGARRPAKEVAEHRSDRRRSRPAAGAEAWPVTETPAEAATTEVAATAAAATAIAETASAATATAGDGSNAGELAAAAAPGDRWPADTGNGGPAEPIAAGVDAGSLGSGRSLWALQRATVCSDKLIAKLAGTVPTAPVAHGLSALPSRSDRLCNLPISNGPTSRR